MSAETIQLIERIHLGSGKVDESSGVIRDVKILGEHSANGRRYRPIAMQEAVNAKLYEDAAVNIDHKQGDAGSRGWSERIATLQNIRFTEGSEGASLVGDLIARKSHPLYSMLMDDAKDGARGVGLSHSIRGQQERSGDVMEITNIAAIISVDLVQNPATTKSLFEKKEAEKMTKTLKQFAESLAESHESKKSLTALSEKHGNIEFSFDEKDSETDRLKRIAEAIYDAENDVASVLDDLAGIKESGKATSEPHDLDQDTKQFLESMTKRLDIACEAIAGFAKREQACTVLRESGAEVCEASIAELSEAEGREVMESMVADWPAFKQKPSSRPSLSNQGIEESREYTPGLDAFLSEVRSIY